MSNSDVDHGINIDDDRGLSDDEWESEQLVSGVESDGEDDEEESYGKFVTFTMPKSMADYKWDLGTYFAKKQDLLDAIKTYAVENGRNIRYLKNDKKRIRAKCMGAKGKFPWMAYCAYMNAIHTWQLGTILDNHSCSREHKVKLLNAKWLSKRLEKTVRENSKVKEVEIVEKINRKWNVGVSRSMPYRAKAIASDHVDGSFKEQYKRIYDYANEVLTRNPGSTVKVKVEENEGRNISGGGELLTALGRDTNDQKLPIAYVIVEVENKDAWKWFMKLLVEDLGGEPVHHVHSYQINKSWSAEKLFEVRHVSQVGDKFVVDIDK
ncbi:uncharacterized protein LOC108336863 [Vigna angularis]|uniref:uncharacterized protein LOC108336863 n=1 Tax=Phaseolus angularis TaxID=3914 RepID=UPI000809EF2F|nr:uncharacterized protein LOC108336863 [Vigna angularis]